MTVTNFNNAWVNQYSEELTTIQKFACKMAAVYLNNHGYEIKDVEANRRGSLAITIKNSNYCLDLNNLTVNEVLIKTKGSYEPLDRNFIEGSLEAVINEICKRSFWKEGLDIKPYLVGFSESDRNQLVNCVHIRPWLRQMKQNGIEVTPDNLPF